VGGLEEEERKVLMGEDDRRGKEKIWFKVE
jgi:hypothetical protein